jgi:16S rRNA processing protein RimM
MDARRWLRAGIVGSPHGLDGSFHVVQPVAGLLVLGEEIRVGERELVIERRAGTDQGPIVRLAGCSLREHALALRGEQLLVARRQAPELEADEWWADDLEGCVVRDGAAEVGKVRRLVALPSCEVLEIERADGGADLLVPLVRDAVRGVDIERREIDIDLVFLGERPG